MANETRNTKIVAAMEMMEGAGVTVHRTIGTPGLRNLDPFMLLDHLSSDNPDDYIAGFPSHPHRGFITFTYMLDGLIEHRDSMGNAGVIEPGGAQWMKAASGVIHSEMPKQKDGLLRGFQLWINLPAARKMDQPEYQEYPASAFPMHKSDGYSVKVVIGDYGTAKSPIEDDITRVSWFDVEVNPDQQFQYEPESGHNTFLYVFEGSGIIDDREVPVHSLVVPDSGHDEIGFTAGPQGARFVLISGKPINESIVQYGPFVMNTREEIDQAMSDFQSNNFVKDRAWIRNRNSPTSKS